jgi:hypothetical protein
MTSSIATTPYEYSSKKTVLINHKTKSTPIFSQINSMKHNKKIGIRGTLNDNLERI